MKHRIKWSHTFVKSLSVILFFLLSENDGGCAASISYNHDIRPILSDNCFACHGPDKANQKANLRLDVREVAVAPAKSGDIAIVPGDVKKSALLNRICSTDEDEVMPPPKSHKTITASEKEKLRLWIEQGAKYEKHWSFVPLAPVAVPAVKQGIWARNDLDRFILARLESEGLFPSPEAAKEKLIRRVTLDLTGLPPTPAEVDAFVADQSPQAYEQVVERLLRSPHYGERMAVDWLDAARYADTNGFQVDRDRELWPWRDWVIKAFNDNLHFDQFTIEQIAGDLLPNATLDQRIATGFNRNPMLNEEGAIIAEEFLAEMVADRVETTAAVWLGQTFNCCRCHDHKFDAFTQRDFYSLKAFFHNVSETGIGKDGTPIRVNAPPFLKFSMPKIEAKIADLNGELKAVNGKLAALDKKSDTDTEKKKIREQLAALKKQITAAENEIPTTLVMDEMKEPRPTFILLRGAYDKKGEPVTAATPAVLPPMAEGEPRNRLGLAKWLVSPQNPLTARVTVNRFWQQVFGTGLVKTSEDFGAQGATPSHPELLDWLALEFIRSGWDVKHLMTLMVTSATYRQQSQLTLFMRERDLENRLLARGPRYRLMGEFVRDQALAASGLLVEKIGGPSVRPYHPPGLYEQVASGSSGATTYVVGKGDDLHRRSLYTYWKRSVPNPAMLAFGTPFRETCTLQRPRSNTPLQALNLMNDETYTEASRFLAERMIRDGGSSMETKLTHGFRLILSRVPKSEELRLLQRAYDRSLADFQKDPAAVKSLLSIGGKKTDPNQFTPELAALTTVASTLFCMDETVTKP